MFEEEITDPTEQIQSSARPSTSQRSRRHGTISPASIVSPPQADPKWLAIGMVNNSVSCPIHPQDKSRENVLFSNHEVKAQEWGGQSSKKYENYIHVEHVVPKTGVMRKLRKSEILNESAHVKEPAHVLNMDLLEVRYPEPYC